MPSAIKIRKASSAATTAINLCRTFSAMPSAIKIHKASSAAINRNKNIQTRIGRKELLTAQLPRVVTKLDGNFQGWKKITRGHNFQGW